VQRRQQQQPFTAVTELARRVRHHNVAFAPRGTAPPAASADFAAPTAAATRAGFGVAISPTEVVTHRAALDGDEQVTLTTADDRTVAARVAAYEPQSGLVLLQADGLAAVPVTVGAEPAAGALAVGAGRSGLGEVAIPVFITAVGSAEWSAAAGTMLPPGLPLFDSAGELLAIAGEAGSTPQIVSLRASLADLVAAASGKRPAAFGLALQDRTPQLARVFGDRGVIVTQALANGPAARAGIRAGDVLLAVAGIEVDAVADALAALTARPLDAPTELRVARARRTRTIEVTPVWLYQLAGRPAGDDPVPSPPLQLRRGTATATLLRRGGVPYFASPDGDR
jgi:S1-C subfamily serine protease